MISRISTYLLVLLMLGLGFWSFRLWMAERIIEANPSVDSYANALRWNPSSDNYHAVLGLSYRDLLDRQDLEAAVRELNTAVEIRPGIWTYHQALAMAYEMKGEFNEAEDSFRKALRLAPRNANLQWQVANFYMRRQNIPETVNQFRAAVELDPGNLTFAANRLAALGVTLGDISKEIVPQRRQDLLRFLSFVLGYREDDPERIRDLSWETWQRWERASPDASFNIRDLFGFIDYLVREGELGKARDVWEIGLREAGIETSRRSKVEGRTSETVQGQRSEGLMSNTVEGRTSKVEGRTSKVEGPKTNTVEGQTSETVQGQRSEGLMSNTVEGLYDGPIVFNGGFEERALNGGFDWVLPRHREVYYEYDHRTRFEGTASLRIDFAGESNLNYRGLQQKLLLPAGRFQLSFCVMSEEINSDQGVLMELRSYPDNKLLASSEPILGSRTWSRIKQEFETKQPGAAYVQLRRYPSEMFNNILSGRIWIDEVSIEPIKTDQLTRLSKGTVTGY